jgi:GDP/UDP-N,N'-diacetylbacillosamine 2-epimerase (hydrolysing)
MKVAVMTSSRADYGIYRPLLKKLYADSFFLTDLIAFGSHLSRRHGHTIDRILDDGFKVRYQLDTMPAGDKPEDISLAMGTTMKEFAKLWASTEHELTFCLGDRFEMFAACASAVPFGRRLAHIHGGEETTGAIDNVFRNGITHMSDLHFASTSRHAERVRQLTNSAKGVYEVGALSLDNLADVKLMSDDELFSEFGIHAQGALLVTFHPETVAYENNARYVNELVKALEASARPIVITMPNADTSNEVVRRELLAFASRTPRVQTVESLGTRGYFSCMALCAYLVGNTSSGIIEAASFGKYAVNIGERQKGREAGPNVFHCAYGSQAIQEAMSLAENAPPLDRNNIYGSGQAAEKIISILKSL